MHLCTSEDPLTGNAGVVIKGLLEITSIAAKASYMNKFCNQPMLLPDSISVLFFFQGTAVYSRNVDDEIQLALFNLFWEVGGKGGKTTTNILLDAMFSFVCSLGEL